MLSEYSSVWHVKASEQIVAWNTLGARRTPSLPRLHIAGCYREREGENGEEKSCRLLSPPRWCEKLQWSIRGAGGAGQAGRPRQV